MHRQAILSIVLVGLLATGASGQPAADFALGSQVEVSALGSVTVDPDYAMLAVQVDVQEDSPADAARVMSRRIDAIMDALGDLGVRDSDVPDRTFSLRTNRDYQRGNEVVGYRASTTLHIRSAEVDALAPLLSAALEHGATDISGVTFHTVAEDSLRRVALERAVDSARKDAAAIAEAHDLALGALVSITTDSRRRQQVALGRPLDMPGLDEVVVTSAAVSPRRVTIRAQVTAAWLIAKPTNTDR
ncbi:MAG: SIMPL domain-containing protein [Rhodothermales bacterium]|nr:SIMPL domain-containing protein [Rhodothermales bacterium]MBO6780804.1 SIMPL domain-containing protein [Rhodothermales bacterium]